MSAQEKIPVEQSVGGQNRHIHWCDAHEQRRFYGSCLSLLNAYEQKRLKPDAGESVHENCAQAMKAGKCAAAVMRAEELDKNEAIYYIKNIGTIDRPQVEKQALAPGQRSKGYNLGWSRVTSTSGTDDKASRDNAAKFAPHKPIKKPEPISNSDYAGMITQLAAEEASKPADAVASKPVETSAKPQAEAPKRRPGESMLEMAKRLRNQKKEQ